MDQNSIILGNLQIFEPVTVLTNLLLAGFCFFWSGAAKGNTPRFWSWFFLLLGSSVLLGAFAHGLYINIDNPAQKYTRFLAIMSVSAGSLASIYVLDNKALIRKLSFLLIFQFVVFSYLVLTYNRFVFVTIHSLLGLGITVGGVFIWQVNRLGSQSVYWMLGGIAVNASTAVIHSLKLSPHPYFNHNDISHLILVLGCFMMFKGAQSAHRYLLEKSLVQL